MEYFNQRWFDYTGLTLQQSQGWGWGAAVHPDDVPRCVRTWNDALQCGAAYEIEFRFRRASDGSYRWHLGRGLPFRDTRGAIVNWLGTATDIDDYKTAEARNLGLQAVLEDRVRQRTAELERVGKITGVGGWSCTVASGAVQWSDETCRILDVQPGYRPTLDEAIGMYVTGSREVLEIAYRNCMANAVPYDLELQLTTAKGRDIWVRGVGEAQIEQGTLVRIFGALQDITARKLAERELSDQHELLRVTLDSIGDAVITTDALGHVQSLNPVAARLTGRTASESRGVPIEEVFDIVDPGTQQRARELLSRALKNDTPASTGMDTVLIAKDGAEIQIEDSIAPIHDTNGNRVGTVLVFRDVSRRKQAAHALLRANERFAIAAGAAGIGVWDWDLATNTLRWDDQMYRLYGSNRGTSVELYSLWAASLHVEDRAVTEQQLRDALRERSNFDTEFRIVHASGAIRHIKAYAQTQCNADGAVIRMIGVNFDITARKQAEIDLKHTSSLLRLVLDSASELSIIATDPSLTINVFNTGAERLLGYASDEIVGRTTPLLIHDAEEVRVVGEELSAQVGRPIEGAAVFQETSMHGRSREWSYLRKDGARVAVALVVTPMQGSEGELLGYLGVAQDVTAQKQYEESLRRATQEAEKANGAKSLFLANMSHEIRTPMNAVIGLTYLLEQTSLNAEQTGLLTQINAASKLLLAVITDVLDLSKIEAGELMISRVAFSPRELLQGLHAIMRSQAELKGITLQLELPDNLPAVLEGDAGRLNQILTNLLSNAIKFTERGGVTLCVGLLGGSSTGSTLSFTVRDTGIGIDPAAQARLFMPFIQADESITRRYGGTGLGLSIINRLAKLMGGAIDFTSNVGVGSEFRVVLKFALATEEALAATKPASVSGGERPLSGVRVLVVDDYDLNQIVTKRILEQAGARVWVANNGQVAVEQLKRRSDHFDVVLMDVQMPIMDGYEATRRIRAEIGLLDLPIVALTAGALVSERQRATAVGMDDFIIKPFDAATLIARVMHHTESVRAALEGIRPAPQTVSGHAAWPEIVGIDMQDVRNRLCDDPALFRELLQDFLDQFTGMAARSSRGVPASLAEQASRLHKLRGAACILGVKAIQHLAAEAEAACLVGDGPLAQRHSIALFAHLDALQASAARAFAVVRPGEASMAAAANAVGWEPNNASECRIDAPTAQPRRDDFAARCRVLLVDDDDSVRSRVANLLEGSGYRVGEAASGPEALRALQAGAYQIVVMDWKMPGMSGLELCRELRACIENRDLYVMMLTVINGPEDVDLCYEAGADAYVFKSAPHEEFIERMSAAKHIAQLRVSSRETEHV
jgi:PAS domain S-box-containing protein